MKKFLFVLLILTSFLQTSCSPDTLDNTPTTNPVDVYVAGFKNNHATYWKNNQLISLQDNGSSFSSADTLIVKNNVVHISGTVYNNGSYENVYWKNGVLTNLTQTFSTPDQVVKKITGFDVVGDDVYFVGYTKNPLITAEIYDLAYWKNGVKTIVNNNVNGICKSNIKVFNNDIYITASNNSLFVPNGYYKNSIFTEIQDLYIRDFSVNNNEISVFGSYQLSNKIHNITTNTDLYVGFDNDAEITFLCFDNNNMYYCDVNEIYKNSTLFIPRPLEYSGLIDFKVLNNNVYVLRGFGANPASALEINNITIFQSAIDEYFKSLYVVQN